MPQEDSQSLGGVSPTRIKCFLSSCRSLVRNVFFFLVLFAEQRLDNLSQHQEGNNKIERR